MGAERGTHEGGRAAERPMHPVLTVILRSLLWVAGFVVVMVLAARLEAALPDHWAWKVAPAGLVAAFLVAALVLAPPLAPRTKKLIGMLAFAPAILLYIGLVLWLAGFVPDHWAALTAFYLVAGTAWAFPLKPVFGWMNKPLPE